LSPDTFLCACQVMTHISIVWWRCHLCVLKCGVQQRSGLYCYG
jgi:hypothetical protein